MYPLFVTDRLPGDENLVDGSEPCARRFLIRLKKLESWSSANAQTAAHALGGIGNVGSAVVRQGPVAGLGFKIIVHD